jgi:hypothetical protein
LASLLLLWFYVLLTATARHQAFASRFLGDRVLDREIAAMATSRVSDHFLEVWEQALAPPARRRQRPQ